MADGVVGQRDDVVMIGVRDAIVAWGHRSALFIDVRNPNEWNLFRIPGAVHVPLPTVAERVRETRFARRDARIIVYCGRGNRSKRAARVLNEFGYTNVHSLEGGIMEWIFRDGAVDNE